MDSIFNFDIGMENSHLKINKFRIDTGLQLIKGNYGSID